MNMSQTAQRRGSVNAAQVERIRQTGAVTARKALQLFPEWSDTTAAAAHLQAMVERGWLIKERPPGRNTQYRASEMERDESAKVKHSQNVEHSPVIRSSTRPPPLRSLGRSRSAATEEQLQVLQAIISKAGTVSISEIRGRYPTGKPWAASSLKRCLSILVAEGRIQLIGQRRNARYASNEGLAGAGLEADPLADSTQTLLLAERRLYQNLVVAALASSDRTVRRIAASVQQLSATTVTLSR